MESTGHMFMCVMTQVTNWIVGDDLCFVCGPWALSWPS